MKIFNPSGWNRVATVGGVDYVIPAFSESKEIYNMDHVEAIPRIYERFGLVALDYNEGAQKVYETFEDYKAEQERRGLRALLKWRTELRDYEKNGELAAKAKPEANGEMRTFNTAKFDKDVDLIEKWLKAAGENEAVKAKEDSDVVYKRPEWKAPTTPKEDKRLIV
jgi:hypothetical protein